jgi:hypothetical protein
MAKKSLGDMAKKDKDSVSDLTEERRNKMERLTFNVTGAQHLQFKKEALDAGLSMTDYFFRLWQGKQ